MRLVCILIAGITSAILLTQVAANCLCGATGEDYCSCKSFRPLPKLLDKFSGPPPKFLPIGDRCWCGKQLVEPAIPPKLCCPKNLPTIYAKPDCSLCGASKSVNLGAPNPCACQGSELPLPYTSHKKKCSGLPADPISVSLAYQMGHYRKFAVPEARLQYGFNTIPLNGFKRMCASNIPEEKLYALNREIIELKKKRVQKKEEEIIEEESEEDIGPNPSYLTYGELGYCPEKFPSAKFVGLPPVAPEIPLPVPPAIGDCGFKPGSIVPFNTEDNKYNYGDCFDDNNNQ